MGDLNKIYLKDGRVIELTEDESMKLAKYMMLLPEHKVFSMGGISFAIKDLDYDAKEKAKLPQQMKLDIRTKSY
jgi:hypothetical protein